MSDATYPKNSTCILWLTHYWDGGSVLCSRPRRRESGHKLQETEIRIWRPAQGLLTTLQQQAGGNRRCQIHQSSSLVHPTPPVAVWPLPQSPQMHRNSTLQAPDNKRAFSLCHRPAESQAKHLAIIAHFSTAFTTEVAQRRLSSLYCGFQDEKWCSIWISHQPCH